VRVRALVCTSADVCLPEIARAKVHVVVGR
jgi:hypothetical protein